ncbi:MAG: DUF1636 family protein [Burkholderiaceae bacterium]
MTTEILVCVTCQPLDISRDAPRLGRQFYKNLNDQVFIEDLAFLVRPIECMGGCSHACTVAFQANNKQRYFFGNLSGDVDCVSQTLSCAKLYGQSTDGVMAWRDRPPLFQKGLIAKLPSTL